ncbi:MAG: hypothetical protein K0R08_1413 [Solimicrobium sp.]|nr:hypothetical protein [Solimicrobium sp.]
MLATFVDGYFAYPRYRVAISSGRYGVSRQGLMRNSSYWHDVHLRQIAHPAAISADFRWANVYLAKFAYNF